MVVEKDNKIIELDDGSLTWIPKTVILDGKEYDAPLDLISYFTYGVLKKMSEKIEILEKIRLQLFVYEIETVKLKQKLIKSI